MAGWVNYPGGISRTDSGVTYNYYQAWEFIAQLTFGMRQRHAMLAGYTTPVLNALNNFPQPSAIWDSGTVESVTDNGDGTITFSMSGVDWTPGTGFSSPKWLDYTNPACYEAHVPANYDLIIDPVPNVETIDPRQTVRGSITGVTFDSGAGTGTITISRGSGPSLFPIDAVTANYIGSVGGLEGLNWYIVKRGGYFNSERMVDRPDEQQKWVGSGSAGGSITVASHVVTVVSGSYTDTELAELATLADGSYSTLADETAGWGTDLWVTTPATELLYWGSDSALHRETILHNFATLLIFAQQTYTGSGAYIIVANGDVGYPGRNLTPVFQWYTGLGVGYKTHLANDDIGDWLLPQNFATVSSGDNCSGLCEGVDIDAFDVDAMVQVDNDCAGSSAGDFIAWKYFKSIRSIQQDIIGTCTSFLPYQDYSEATIINLWNPATFFYYLNINAWACGYTYVDSSHLTISGTPDGVEFPHTVYYAILNADGSYGADTGTLTNATTLTPDTLTFSNTDPIPTGVTLSLGFSRYRPRHVRHFYPKTCFLPYSDDSGAVDPPTVDFDESGNVIDHTGQWVRRGPSTTYKSRSNTGVAGDGAIAFVDGELATHVGDNAPDTCIYSSDGVPIISSSGASLLSRVPYYDHYFRGKYDKVKELERLGSTAGLSTGGTAHSLTDSTKSWWDDGINVTTPLHTETGTATSGSTTSLTDTSHVTTGSTNPEGCWWSSSRFLGFSDPSQYTDFILNIVRTVDEYTVLSWKVPITSTTSGSGGVVINFAAVAGLTVAAGDVWSIIEPAYEINKWENRVATLTDPSGGSQYQTLITHSDDDTIFFGQVYDSSGGTTSITVGSNWSYSIDDRRFGGVWKWNATGGLDGSGAWDIPTGDDVARLGNGGAPQPFQTDQTMNLPTIVKDYGKVMVDDIICTELFTEMQTAINALRATKVGGTFCAGRTETMEDYLVDILGDTGDDRDYSYPMGDDGSAAWASAYASYLLSIANQLDGGVDEISEDPWPPPQQGNIDTVSHPQKVYDSFFGEGSPTDDVEGGGEILSAGVSETGYAKATNVCTLFPSSMDAYVRATIDAADEPPSTHTVDNVHFVTEFDPTDNPVEYHIYTKVSSDGDSSDGPVRVSETKLGDLSTNIPPVFRNIGFYYDKLHGWYAPDPTLIFKWEFTYV